MILRTFRDNLDLPMEACRVFESCLHDPHEAIPGKGTTDSRKVSGGEGGEEEGLRQAFRLTVPDDTPKSVPGNQDTSHAEGNGSHGT